MITIGIYSFLISLCLSLLLPLPYAHFVQCIQITFYWCDFPPVLTLIFISSHTDFYILRISTLAETSCFHVKFNPRQMHCCVSWTSERAGEWVTADRSAQLAPAVRRSVLYVSIFLSITAIISIFNTTPYRTPMHCTAPRTWSKSPPSHLNIRTSVAVVSHLTTILQSS